MSYAHIYTLGLGKELGTYEAPRNWMGGRVNGRRRSAQVQLSAKARLCVEPWAGCKNPGCLGWMFPLVCMSEAHPKAKGYLVWAPC